MKPHAYISPTTCSAWLSALDAADVCHDVGPRIDHRSPALVRVINALVLGASQAQPHGALIGDAIFEALAAMLTFVPIYRMRRTSEQPPHPTSKMRDVR